MALVMPVKKEAPKKQPKKTPPASGEFAVIETGGKQYRVAPGDVVTIEKITGNSAAGDSITFDKVLLVDDGANTTIGTPYIKGAAVIATLIGAGKGKKVIVIKYKAKSRYFKKRGHRQPFYKVRIEKIK